MSAWRILPVLLAAAGCVRSGFNLATERQEYTLTSTEKEIEMGRHLAARAEEELGLASDVLLQQRVQDIGERIAAVCDRQELRYHFAVVEEEDVNAFSLPGGYIFLNDGLIKETANDDELAGVIAHEVAHITARHAVKRYEGNLGLQLAQLATMATRQGQAAQGVGALIHTAQLAYARQDELEADRLAVKYLRAAGYRPEGMLTFLEKLRALNQDRTQYLPRGVVRPHYALTHPFVADRMRAVKEALYGVAEYLDYLNAPE